MPSDHCGTAKRSAVQDHRRPAGQACRAIELCAAGGQVDDLADLPGVDHLVERVDVRQEPGPHRLHDEHPGGAWKFVTEKVEVGTDERSGKPIVATRPDWDDIDAALATYEARAKSFGSAMVARARFLGAYLESPPRVGLTPEPIAVMQAIGAPLRDIPELAGAFT